MIGTFPRFLQLILNDVLTEEENMIYEESETRVCLSMKKNGISGLIDKPPFPDIPLVLTPYLQSLGLPL